MTQGKPGAWHAIAPTSSYEPLVMETIASLGGGSFHRVQGRNGPQAYPRQLWTEMLQPGLRNLHLEFSGVKVDKVYPARLPNLAAGTQQMVLGRYEPAKGPMQFQATVTGTQDGKPVRFNTNLALQPNASGNGWLPRLWARSRLDALLARPGVPAIQNEIIDLSYDYRILTPYTSFLVLESEADRALFNVGTRKYVPDDKDRLADENPNPTGDKPAAGGVAGTAKPAAEDHS